MKVELNFESGKCIVIKEEGDKSIPVSGWIKTYGGDPSSTLLYNIKKILNKRGYNLIKKRMSKDGHLTSEEKQYLVTRNKRGQNFCIYDSQYDIRDAREDFNIEGKVVLSIECETDYVKKLFTQHEALASV